MAYVVGFATADEIAELSRRGWEVEEAASYNLVGHSDAHLLHEPLQAGDQAVLVWVDSSAFDIMDGPDWDKGDGLPSADETPDVSVVLRASDTRIGRRVEVVVGTTVISTHHASMSDEQAENAAERAARTLRAAGFTVEIQEEPCESP